MRIDVEHTTRYSYGAPVFLEPMTIRLRPGGDDAQRVVGNSMRIDPEPAGTTDLIDAEGNLVTRAWFDGLHEQLSIKVRSEVVTLRENPFDYILLEPVSLPVEYPRHEISALARFRSEQASPTVLAFANEGPEDLQAFLAYLTGRLHGFGRYIREEGDPLPAEETLSARTGSCRDLAVLMMDACRARGLAARFVSGYAEGDPEEPEQHMHAWCEVYIPGGGWRGYDPTLGVAVADRHVWLARAPDPRGAAPTGGTYRGSVASKLDVSLKVRVR